MIEIFASFLALCVVAYALNYLFFSYDLSVLWHFK